jgi:hypothetical protein
MEFPEPVIDINDKNWIYEPPEDSKIFSIKASFNDGYKWSKLLKTLNKYGDLLFEAYWYDVPHNRSSNRSIRRGEYRIVTNEPTNLKKSLTWLQKLEYMTLDIREENCF